MYQWASETWDKWLLNTSSPLSGSHSLLGWVEVYQIHSRYILVYSVLVIVQPTHTNIPRDMNVFTQWWMQSDSEHASISWEKNGWNQSFTRNHGWGESRLFLSQYCRRTTEKFIRLKGCSRRKLPLQQLEINMLFWWWIMTLKHVDSTFTQYIQYVQKTVVITIMQNILSQWILFMNYLLIIY